MILLIVIVMQGLGACEDKPEYPVGIILIGPGERGGLSFK